MSNQSEVVVIPRSERLRDSRRQATSMALPLAVNHRLDLLVECAEDAHATRAEVIGTLIARAALDPEELEGAVLSYRKMKVGDVIPDADKPPVEVEETAEVDNVVSIVKHGPGRRGKRDSA